MTSYQYDEESKIMTLILLEPSNNVHTVQSTGPHCICHDRVHMDFWYKFQKGSI